MTKKYLKASADLPFSVAVLNNDKFQVEISGQIGLDEEGKLVEGIEEQTRRTMKNLIKILEGIGLNLDSLTKVRIYLTQMKDYSIVNEIYSSFFKGNFPARIAIAVNELPLGALIEIDATASSEILENV